MRPTIHSRLLRSIDFMMKKPCMYFFTKSLSGNMQSVQPTPPPNEQLSSLAKDLLDDIGRVESDFLKIGRDLMKTHEEASALEQHACQAVSLVTGEKGLAHRIDWVVHGSLTQLQSSRDKVHKDLGKISEGIRLMEALSKRCEVFDKMVLELQMIGLNVGVESVRSVEGRNMFGNLASDVRQLSSKIAEIAVNIHSDTRRTADIQDKAHREIAKDVFTIIALAEDAEKAAREAVEDIKTLMSLSASTIDEVGKYSKEISKEVGRIVEGIQFHDNMHQRITHITEALAETSYVVSTRRETLVHVHSALALQAAQLKQLLGEVKNARTMTSCAFDEIIRCLKNISDSVSIFNSETVTTSPETGICAAKHQFAKIGNVIKYFNEIIAKGHQLHGRILEAFGDAGSSMKKLSNATEQVHRINFEIHLIALNAIVKTAQLGSKGQALEVLAYALNELSDKSGLLVSQVNDLLGKITRTEIDHSPEMDADEKSDILRKESEMEIEMVYERLDAAGIEITNRSKALMQSVSDTRHHLSFLNDLEERLNRRLHSLQAWIHVTPSPDGLNETIQNNGIDQLKSRYTMEQERIIHEAQTGQSCASDTIGRPDVPSGETEWVVAGALPRPESLSAATSTKSELGDNVELF